MCYYYSLFAELDSEELGLLAVVAEVEAALKPATHNG